MKTIRCARHQGPAEESRRRGPLHLSAPSAPPSAEAREFLLRRASGGPVPARWRAHPPRRSSRRSRSPPPARPRWTLATSDTKLVIGVGLDQQPYIQELSSPAGWNWTKVPLPVSPGGSRGCRRCRPDSELGLSARHGGPDGRHTAHTHLHHVRPSPGVDVALAGAQRTRPCAPHDVHQEQRGPAGDDLRTGESASSGRRSGAGHQRLVTSMTTAACPTEPVCTTTNCGPATRRRCVAVRNRTSSPFTVVDAHGEHGVYLGWEWSLGRMGIAAHQSPGSVSVKAGNGDGFKTDLAGRRDV